MGPVPASGRPAGAHGSRPPAGRDKAFERRQVDSERKRQYLQTREFFSIWCSVCNKFFSNRLLSHTRKDQWRTLSQRHIEMIKQMLDKGEKPDCPQCLRSAEFFEDVRPVYTTRQTRVLIEALDRKKSERQATLASAIQPASVYSPSRGDKWMSAIGAVLSVEKEKRSQQKQREDDKKEKARREKWRICRCLYNNYDERRNYVMIEHHSGGGDHELFLNALGPGARKASEGFTWHKEECKWWVPIANVAKWVTVHDEAIREDTISDDFILDLVRNADRPPAGGIKFVTAQ